METYRKFLKADGWDEWAKLDTDQRKQIPAPLPQKGRYRGRCQFSQYESATLPFQINWLYLDLASHTA